MERGSARPPHERVRQRGPVIRRRWGCFVSSLARQDGRQDGTQGNSWLEHCPGIARWRGTKSGTRWSGSSTRRWSIAGSRSGWTPRNARVERDPSGSRSRSIGWSRQGKREGTRWKQGRSRWGFERRIDPVPCSRWVRSLVPTFYDFFSTRL